MDKEFTYTYLDCCSSAFIVSSTTVLLFGCGSISSMKMLMLVKQKLEPFSDNLNGSALFCLFYFFLA